MTNKYLLKENYSSIGVKLLEILKKVWDDEDFIIGTMLECNTDEKKQKLLNFIIETGTTNSDDIIPYSIKIDKGLV